MEAQGPLGSSNLDAELRLELDALASAGRLRNVQGRPRGLVDFTSNDYLGLASHELVIEAAQEANARYGAGGRAARLLARCGARCGRGSARGRRGAARHA